MRFVRMAGALALALLLPACATVVRGTKEAFVIDSDPTSAAVALSTGQSCTTPCSLKLKRKDPFTVHVTHDGYAPVDASVTSETRGGAVAGNILLGGIIGAGVDASNGSLKSLVPNPLHVKMTAAAPPASPPPPASATSTDTAPSAAMTPPAAAAPTAGATPAPAGPAGPVTNATPPAAPPAPR